MAREIGASICLNAYPRFRLDKQQFWDGISIRYG